MKLACQRGFGPLRGPATQVVSGGKLYESVHVSVMGRDVSGHFGILALSGLKIWHLGHDLPTRLRAGDCGSGVLYSFMLQRPAWLVAIALKAAEGLTQQETLVALPGSHQPATSTFD